MKQTVTGMLSVFRESSQRGHLSAVLKTETTESYWFKAPKCFLDVVTGTDNLVEIECDVTTSTDSFKNPRNVKVIHIITKNEEHDYKSLYKGK